MFMRYRGGGIGHKYMRDVEKKHEDMSLEHVHGDSRQKPPQAHPEVPGTSSGGRSNISNSRTRSADVGRSGNSVSDDDGSDGDELDCENGPDVTDRDASDADGDESIDSDGASSTAGDSDEGGEQGDHSSEDSTEDSDEIDSVAGDESYGLADP